MKVIFKKLLKNVLRAFPNVKFLFRSENCVYGQTLSLTDDITNYDFILFVGQISGRSLPSQKYQLLSVIVTPQALIDGYEATLNATAYSNGNWYNTYGEASWVSNRSIKWSDPGFSQNWDSVGLKYIIGIKVTV